MIEKYNAEIITKDQSRRVEDLTVGTLHTLYPSDCGEADETDPVFDLDVESSSPSPDMIDILAGEEFIVYRNSGKRRFNPCFHTRWRRSGYIKSIFKALEIEGDFDMSNYSHSGDPRHRYCPKETFEGFNELSCQGLLWAEGVGGPSSYLQLSDNFDQKVLQLDQMAMAAMIPRLDTGFSMPRFLFELMEVKLLVRSIFSVLRGLSDRKAVLRALKQPLRSLSDGYLATIFGAMPLVEDIGTIIEKFRSLSDRVDDFLDYQGKPLTYHFSKQLHPSTFDTSGYLDPVDTQRSLDTAHHSLDWWFAESLLGSGYNITFRRERTIRDFKFCATLKFEYSLPFERSRGIQRFLAELDHWGVNLSISDIWEVIPFSFVLDWVFDIGSWLEDFDLENLPVNVRVLDYCHSLKFEESETESPADPDWIASGKHECFRKVYWREVIPPPMPGKNGVPSLELPGTNQWIIGAALLASGGRFRRFARSD